MPSINNVATMFVQQEVEEKDFPDPTSYQIGGTKAHLFGGVYHDWGNFSKETMTKAYFLGMLVAGGSGIDNRITEFEKMMVVMMCAY
jgi:hypothetical protein